MSDQQSYPGQVHPGQQYAAQPAYPYGQPGYPYGGPSLRYEPLPRRHKRAAFWAGGIGLNLMSLGGNIVGGLVLVALFLALFASISASAGTDSGLQGFDEFLRDVNAPLWGLGIAAAGFVIFLLGMFASVGILARAEVRRPWAVTWSAFAITILPLVFVNFLLSALGQIVASVSGFAIAGASPTDDPLVTFGGLGIASLLGLLLVTIGVVWVIGALAWWWMAHAFRERIPMR